MAAQILWVIRTKSFTIKAYPVHRADVACVIKTQILI